MGVDDFFDVIDCIEDFVKDSDCLVFVDSSFLSFSDYFEKKLVEISSYDSVSTHHLKRLCKGIRKIKSLVNRSQINSVYAVVEDLESKIAVLEDKKRYCDNAFSKRILSDTKNYEKFVFSFKRKSELFKEYISRFKKVIKGLSSKLFYNSFFELVEKRIRDFQIAFDDSAVKLIAASLLYESDSVVCVATRNKNLIDAVDVLQKNKNFLGLPDDLVKRLKSKPVRFYYFNPVKNEYIEIVYPAIKAPEKRVINY